MTSQSSFHAGVLVVRTRAGLASLSEIESVHEIGALSQAHENSP
jgi:hypothetical protein